MLSVIIEELEDYRTKVFGFIYFPELGPLLYIYKSDKNLSVLKTALFV